MLSGRLQAMMSRRIPIGQSSLLHEVQSGGSPFGFSMVWRKCNCRVERGMSHLLHIKWRKIVLDLSLLFVVVLRLMHRLHASLKIGNNEFR